MQFFKKYGRKMLVAGILPVEINKHDAISKDNKTYKAFLERAPDNETGIDRLKNMFKLDAFGSISSELNSIYQAGFAGFILGGILGGITHSRVAYMDFMDNNQATAFKSHLDAKKKLQDNFTVNFAKGALKWGWRIGLFTTTYIGIITCIAVYREKSSIYEYLAAGTITGTMYRINMGLKGMLAAGIVGGVLGGIAGTASLLIMRASGTSMEEIRYWQYKWRLQREEQVQEAWKRMAEDAEPTPELLKGHDARVGKKIKLDEIE